MSLKKSLLAAVAAGVPLALSGSAVAGDQPHPHGAPPGQAVAEEKSQRDAAPVRAGKAEQKPAKTKAAKQPKAAKTKAAKQPKTTGSRANSNPRANAGKTTICHATGSETNPFVTITISNNALDAHRAHQDGRDMVPAPTEGCPDGSTAAAAKSKAKAKDAQAPAGKTTICHATGSETNPFVTITISDNALDAHRAHQDGRDIVPAPTEGCPGPAAAAASRRAESLALRNAPAAPAAPGAPGAPATAAVPVVPAATGVLGEVTGGDGAVLDAGPARRESGSSAPAAAAGGEGSNLPFTGLDLALVVAAGLAALLGGIALRRSLAGGRTAA